MERAGMRGFCLALSCRSVIVGRTPSMYMYADCQNGIYCDTQMVHSRLKKLSETHRRNPRKITGEFLIRAREKARRNSWARALGHWFQMIALIESSPTINLRRHEQLVQSRKYVNQNHVFTAAVSTDRMAELDPALIDPTSMASVVILPNTQVA